MADTPKKKPRVRRTGQLVGASYNPRRITDEQLANLRASMLKFGDLGGITRNTRTGNLVTGHQRLKQLDPSWKISVKPATDDTGTVALGYIETPFGRFAFREVDWDEPKEKAANIAANAHGGDFDEDALKAMLTDLEHEFDKSILGFTDLDMDKLFDRPQPKKRQGVKHGSSFGVIVDCENLEMQQAAFAAIQKLGYTAREISPTDE